jgi:hypothetical protein
VVRSVEVFRGREDALEEVGRLELGTGTCAIGIVPFAKGFSISASNKIFSFGRYAIIRPFE